MSSTGFGDIRPNPGPERTGKIEKLLLPLQGEDTLAPKESKGLKPAFSSDKFTIKEKEKTENLKEINSVIKLYENAVVDLQDARPVNSGGTIRGVYKPQFERTFFDKVRQVLDLDNNKD